MSDSNLVNSLKELQSNLVVYSHLTRGFYWNTESVLMRQSRIIYEEIYRESEKHVDELSDWLRRLKAEAPYTLEEFAKYQTLGDVKPDTYCGVEMAVHLSPINAKMVSQIQLVTEIATADRQYGLAAFLSDLMSVYQTWDWFLESSLKLPPNPWKSLKD